ncbi:MAG: T9SS type A sorting domain-containing protein, partial [Ignavibacteriaceae bacterium]|nr:T9SS type A sorting domain-containing protein [Ignavibacteriaceae bacterium]
QMYDPLLLNHFIYHAYNEYWIEGIREYLPVKVVVERIISDVNNDYPVVNGYNLYQNYPNPFNPNTVINYSIQEAGLVKIKVYDILGREVAILINETKEAGYHSVVFNASNLPSGVYIYTLKVNGYADSKKMLLLK